MLASASRAQFGERLLLGGRRRELVEAGGDTVGGQRVENARGKRLFGQFVERVDTDDLEHGRDGVRVRPDVPVGEAGLVVIVAG